MKNVWKSAAACLGAVVMMGCSATTRYAEPATAAGEVARIQDSLHGVSLLAIDGQELGAELGAQVALTAGEHEITVKHVKMNTHLRPELYGKKTFTFEAIEGREYLVDASIGKSGIHVWVKDQQNGIIVAGTTPAGISGEDQQMTASVSPRFVFVEMNFGLSLAVAEPLYQGVDQFSQW